jgi:signal transduction histidine kinase
MNMRFNDLLRTVLANTGEGAGAAITRWRQCVDLLAQYDVSGARSGPVISPHERNVVLSIIEEMRPRVSLDQRIASVVELGSRLRSAALVRLLSQDHPSLVVAMMQEVRLTGQDWARIIPDLGPLARSVLRRRADLDPLAHAALRQFGEIDLSLPPHEHQNDAGECPPTDVLDLTEQNELGTASSDDRQKAPAYDRSSQIGRLVERIERFKEERGERELPESDRSKETPLTGSSEAPQEKAQSAQAPDQFLYETDSFGLVQVVDKAPRAALLGLSISTPSVDSRQGVDGKTLGAFRHRAAFENARLVLLDGTLAGEWRIDGEPHFDRLSGRFLGYTGSARREQRYERPVRSSAETAESGWSGLSAASMRQLIHELRTPLNAVQGYSEMIEAQILGPVPDAYRDMAKSILTDARALIETFDDLDIASRIMRGDAAQCVAPVDVDAIIRSVIASLDVERAGRVDLTVEQGLPMIVGDRAHVERMLSHLVRTGLAALGNRERLTIDLNAAGIRNGVNLVVTRPVALQGIDENELFEHKYLVDDQLRGEGPALGLAFTLRLVRGIVRHLGGSFSVTAENFRIRLNAVPMSGAGQESKA